MLRLSCLPSLMDGVLLVILRMRPASPKSTVSGHREIIIIIVRETIAIRGERDIPRDAVSGGTPSNKAMEKICMQETAPAGKVVKKRREEGKRKKKKTISRQKINKIKSRVSFKE